MDVALYLIRQTGLTLIGVIEIAMFARAIFSWFDQTGESKISMFLYAVTEPIIWPIRALCNKMHWFEGLPLDIPFMLTYLVLILLQAFLSAF